MLFEVEVYNPYSFIFISRFVVSNSLPVLTLVLPGMLPTVNHADDLAPFKHSRWHLTGLAQALCWETSRQVLASDKDSHEYFRSLAAQRWMAEQFGLTPNQDGALPLAPYQLLGNSPEQRADLTTFSGDQFDGILQCVHIHAARDHLVLTDPAALEITAEEELALLKAAAESFAEWGDVQNTTEPGMWRVRSKHIQDLSCSAPECAFGRNIDRWMPEGKHARLWRRVQNEIQMIWFNHPVNEKRAEQGLLPINSIWLHGVGQWQSLKKPPFQIFGDVDWLKGLVLSSSGKIHQSVTPDLITQKHDESSCFWIKDAGKWIHSDNPLETLLILDQTWIEGAMSALSAGYWGQLRLILSNDFKCVEINVESPKKWQFWKKPYQNAFFNLIKSGV